jgi:hypothetical protein
MNSFFGFVVGLLQSTLSLLGFVQQHPELPVDQKQQVQQVAEQAVDQATQIIKGAPQGERKTIGDISFVPPSGWHESSNGVYQSSDAKRSTSARSGMAYNDNWLAAGYEIAVADDTGEPVVANIDSPQAYVDFELSTGLKDCSNCSETKQITVDGVPAVWTKVKADNNGGWVYVSGRNNHKKFAINLTYADSYDQGGAAFIHFLQSVKISKSGSTSEGSAVNVPGMSKYTDSDFGFSFWYPTGWKVQEHMPSKAPETYFPGGVVQKSYNIMDSDGSSLALSISTVTSTAGSITLEDDNGNTYTLYFDKNSHTWMRCLSKSGVAIGDCAHATSIAPADVSTNSMGGLHIIGTVNVNSSGLVPDVVPLSAHNFIVIYHDAEKIDALAQTIVALDPSVATPVSAAEQTATIQAEAKAYGVTQTGVSNMTQYVDPNPTYHFTFQYPSDFKPAAQLTKDERIKVSSYMGACPTGDLPSAGPALCYIGGETAEGFEAAAIQIAMSGKPTIEECTAMAKSTKVINGVTFYYDQTGDAGLGHRLSIDRYRTYFNGDCYQVSLEIAGNVGNGSGPDQTFQQKMMDKLTVIMQTFKFTVAETVGPKHSAPQRTAGWKIYTGKMPFTFKYPDQMVLDESSGSRIAQADQNVGISTVSGWDLPGMLLINDSTKTESTLDAVRADEPKKDSQLQGFKDLTLGGEPAIQEITGPYEAKFTSIFAAHAGKVYYFLFNNPLPGQVDTFVSSFAFTN